MATPANWKGYNPKFLEGFTIPFPALGKWEGDLAVNDDTKHHELHYINFSSIQSISRRLPIVTGSNIYREKWVQASREGSFKPDARIKKEEQFSTAWYSDINKLQDKSERKMAKGHMVRREDVQWDENLVKENAIEAAEATFHYTNAIPQHQSVNNVIWKNLENSILIKGRSKNPKKAIVFTGPILQDNDPWLVFQKKPSPEIRCPLRFWKVIYYVTEADELKYAAFLMSHKEEVEEDGYVITKLKLREIFESLEKPFLDFDEKEKYQVNVSLIEQLTGLKFSPAIQVLKEGTHAKLSEKMVESFKGGHIETFDSFSNDVLVEGLIV